jgi:putative transposase
MTESCAPVSVDLLGYCVMPNHFHVVLRSHHDGDLGRWIQSLLTTHARRHHRHYGTSGHVWQGRFKAFPVDEDDHLVPVLQYVERNAWRAELVSRAEDWKWSSLPRSKARDPLLWRGKLPVRHNRWLERVNQPLSASVLQRLRHSIERGRPYGRDAWTVQTAIRLGLESSLRPRGRPKQTALCFLSLFVFQLGNCPSRDQVHLRMSVNGWVLEVPSAATICDNTIRRTGPVTGLLRVSVTSRFPP